MTEPSQLVALAREILSHATEVQAYCEENGISPPSFHTTGPPSFQIPANDPVATALASLLQRTNDLHLLAKGPMSMLMSSSHLDDSVSLHIIHRFSISQKVPIDGQISFKDLSRECGLNVVDLRRVLRQAMTRHIFREPELGFVSHSAASKLLAQNKLVSDFVGMTSDESFKSAAFTADALEKWNAAQDPSQSGFSLGHDTDKGMYAWFQDHPDRAHRWANAMSQFASRIPLDPLIHGFDWASLGHAIVVDVGGGHGPVSIALAKVYPSLQFIVQDFINVVNPRPDVDPDISQRINFMAHSFLDEQPVKGAAVYFLRAVFHNYPDAQCIKALRLLSQAMSTVSQIVINERLLHRPGEVSEWNDRLKRSHDLRMMSYFGSRERDEDDWKELIETADPRLELRSVTLPAASANHILVISFKS